MIKILILEDNANKLSNIKKAILNDFIKEENITTVVCTNEVKQKLVNETFDLFIMDLLVPIRFGEEPKASNSIDLLFDIKNDDEFNKPTYIIGLSAFDSEIESYKKEFNDKNWNLVSYSDHENNWEKKINETLDYILRSKNNNTNDYDYDIAIVCALVKPELSNILDLPVTWIEKKVKNSNVTFYETYFERDGKKLSVIAGSTNQMGLVQNSILSTQMIHLFKPKYLAMTGITAGIKDSEVDLGDALVFQYSWDYNAGKIKQNNNKEKVFEVDMRQEKLDNNLYLNFDNLKRDVQFLFNTYNRYKPSKPSTLLKIHIGHVASGAAVIANESIAKEVKDQARKLLGIEMEGYGIFCSANNAIEPKPIPLVIKSVCDYADENKNDDIQDYAAYTSAQILYEYALRYL